MHRSAESKKAVLARKEVGLLASRRSAMKSTFTFQPANELLHKQRLTALVSSSFCRLA